MTGFLGIYDAIRLGISLKTVHDITKMDYWFLKQIEELVALEFEIEKYHIGNKRIIVRDKMKGYADRQIAHLLRCLESEVHEKRNRTWY